MNEPRRGLGGTDIGTLFGVNPYKTLPRLFLEKTERFPEQVNDWEGLEWGKLLEAPVAKQYSQRTGRRIQLVKRTIVHPKHSFLIGHPDRWQFDKTRGRCDRKGIVEVKCAIFSKLRDWSKGGIPASYYLQLQHYLELTGCTWGSFVVLFGGNRLVHFDVPRDDAVIQLILSKACAFWDYVQRDAMPPIPLTAAINDELGQLFPKPTKQEILQLTTEEAVGRARAILRLKGQMALKQAALAEHEAWFKIQMADHTKALVPAIASLNWSTYERKHTDLELLRNKYPDIANAITNTITSRRFSMGQLETDVDLTEDDEPALTIFNKGEEL